MPIQQMFLGLGAAKEMMRYIWGSNEHPYSGMLGQNQGPAQSDGYSSPVQLTAGNVPWVGHSLHGQGVSAMVREDGTYWTWGSGTYGQLGHNQATNTAISSPVQVGSDTTWSSTYNKMSGDGSAYTFANIKTDGTLWMWGRCSEGQCGQGDTNDRSSPVQIPGTNWVHVRNNYSRTHALKSDGTLWAWGNNGELLGVNTPENNDYSSPKQIPGTSWTTNMTILKNGGACVRTDGTLWMWGANDNGILGQNSPGPHRKSPIQVGSDTTWSKVAGDAARDAIFAFKTDGTLWSWGINGNGNLGHNNKTTYSSPKQVTGTTWNTIRTCNYATLGIKNDGTLWSWGANYAGKLGHNDDNKRSSPVQVGSATGWQADTLSIGQDVASATLEE